MSQPKPGVIAAGTQGNENELDVGGDTTPRAESVVGEEDREERADTDMESEIAE